MDKKQSLELKKLIQPDLGIELDFFVDSKWASTYADHRLNIRKYIYKKTQEKSVLNLDEWPQISEGHISISHCPILGGYVLATQPIGFDLEQKQRLSPSILKRISLASELKLFSQETLPLIWTVKESIYKLNQCQDGVIPEVEIQSVEFCKDSSLFSIRSLFRGNSFLSIGLCSEEKDLVLTVSRFL